MVGWLLPRPPVWSDLGPVPRSPESPPMKDDPLQTVQPVVVPAQLYTCGTAASGFFALIPAFFAGLITMAITERPGPSIVLGIVIYLISFAGGVLGLLNGLSPWYA
jgi:hypothetical protein